MQRLVPAANPCFICGKAFQVIYHRVNVAKYCSQKCYHKSMKGRGNITVKCQTCEREFRISPSRIHRKKFCSKICYAIWDCTRPSRSPYPNNIRRKLGRMGIVTKCSTCGYSSHPEILEIHHIDHDRSNNQWDNLTVICPNCHKLHHFKQHNYELKSVREDVMNLLKSLRSEDLTIRRNGFPAYLRPFQSAGPDHFRHVLSESSFRA